MHKKQDTIKRCIQGGWDILDSSLNIHVGKGLSALVAGPHYSRCEVSGGSGCFGGVRVQSGSPDSAFVTQKRSDPVPCVSLAQHGLAI